MECWGTRSLRGDSLIGVTQIPISNSYINVSPAITFSLAPLNKPDISTVEIELKIKLDPAVSVKC